VKQKKKKKVQKTEYLFFYSFLMEAEREERRGESWLWLGDCDRRAVGELITAAEATEV
jgi:hypothetical protein